MRVLNEIETEEYTLEVIECDCGFHIGLDATYLSQVGDINIKCPSCGETISVDKHGE
jgi:DNA-directed RNA polymerase subunit RPC12/RpoP